MKSRFISDPQDPFGDGVLGNGRGWASSNHEYISFVSFSSLRPATAAEKPFPPASRSPPALIFSAPTPIAPVEAVQAQMPQQKTARADQVPWSPRHQAALPSISYSILRPWRRRKASGTASSRLPRCLSAAITDKITVNVQIDYSGTGGGAAAGPDSGQFENYSTSRPTSSTMPPRAIRLLRRCRRDRRSRDSPRSRSGMPS